jgi:hypothetical protein
MGFETTGSVYVPTHSASTLATFSDASFGTGPSASLGMAQFTHDGRDFIPCVERAEILLAVVPAERPPKQRVCAVQCG